MQHDPPADRERNSSSFELPKKHIAGKSKIAFIHVSFDEKEKHALNWAKKEGFPWLTVLGAKREASDLEKFAVDFNPEYLLISPEGKLLTKGKEECFAKIKAMGSKGS